MVVWQERRVLGIQCHFARSHTDSEIAWGGMVGRLKGEMLDMECLSIRCIPANQTLKKNSDVRCQFKGNFAGRFLKLQPRRAGFLMWIFVD